MRRKSWMLFLFGLMACGTTPSGVVDVLGSGDAGPDGLAGDVDRADAPSDGDPEFDGGAADVGAQDSSPLDDTGIADAQSPGDADDVSDVETVCPGERIAEDDRRISTGVVRGSVTGNSIAFLGIPFARPPVGELRWRPPQPADCLDGVYLATEWAQPCAQNNEEGEFVGSEDCLTLNVWQPLPVTDSLSPVLVFIHGGGNIQGSAGITLAGGVRLYDSADFASETGAVVVTIQYRLGVFGWLTRPRETWSDGKGGEGNLGLLDQLAALQWVQDNIQSFGGDPSRVVIFGQSAGARNVCALAVSPAAEGLFKGAIMQSGACALPPESEILGETQRFLDTFAVCEGDLDCLRGLDAEELVRGYPLFVNLLGTSSFTQPWVDGSVVPAQPEDLLRAGAGVADFMIVGANDDETSRYVPETLTELQLRDTLNASFGPTLADAIQTQYPLTSFGSPAEAYTQITSDARFVCSARRTAAAAHEGGTPVWHYHFEQQINGRAGTFGSWHGLEMLYLFDALTVSGYRPTASEIALGALMRSHWVSLAANGSPSADDSWPAWSADNLNSMRYIAGESALVSGVRAAQCDFWDSYYDSLAP